MADADEDAMAWLIESLKALAETDAAICEANGVAIPIKIFKQVIDGVMRLAPDQDVIGRALVMAMLLAGMVEEDDIPRFSRSIELRMQALASLRAEPAFGAWSLRISRTKPEAVDQLMIDTAARQPMIALAGGAAFEPESFFATVLDGSTVKGSA